MSALRATEVLALTVAGVDVLQGRDGPVVIAAKPFPNGRRLPDAAVRLADHPRSLAEPVAPASAIASMVGEEHL